MTAMEEDAQVGDKRKGKGPADESEAGGLFRTTSPTAMGA